MGIVMFADEVGSTTTKVFSDAQMTSIKGSLSSTISGVVDTFVDLLPIIALITAAIFGIRFVKSKFNTVSHTKG